jgi:anthranilate synthase component 1
MPYSKLRMDQIMTLEEFEKLVQTYNVIPVSKNVLADTLNPVSAYLRLRAGSKNSFLFESVEGGEHVARYSFIGCDPIMMIRCDGTKTTIVENGTQNEVAENFFDILQSVVVRFRQPSLPSLPRFTGGLVGFIGYDTVRFIENIPCAVSNTIDLPDSILGLFTSIIIFDHIKHQITIVANEVINPHDDLAQKYNDAQERIVKLESILFSTAVSSTEFHSLPDKLTAETTHEEFTTIVSKAKQFIHDGDIFQVVLSQRFSTPFNGDTFNAYRALRIINPSPYLYYLDFERFTVIGSSPEILVRVENGVAEVYPIAGTRHRGTTEQEDKALENELLNDAKEVAEHVMLVDLGRNDLGRVCEIGSVKVDQMMNVVRYSHVMHIASRVVGTVQRDKSCIDVLRGTFPAGTVSGAPKIRAMEIIDELESTRRGIYAGGVGYFDFSGNMDMCIAIRTIFATNGTLYFQTGAGIVADSIPENEYNETLNKARALVEALRTAEGTMR